MDFELPNKRPSVPAVNTLLFLSCVFILSDDNFKLSNVNDGSIAHYLICSITGRSIDLYNHKPRYKSHQSFISCRDHFGKPLLYYACCTRRYDYITLAHAEAYCLCPDDIYQCIALLTSQDRYNKEDDNVILILLSLIIFNDFICANNGSLLFEIFRRNLFDITFKDVRLNSLHVAASLNDIESVRYLIEECSASVNCLSSDEKYPLYYAIFYGAEKTVLYLGEKASRDVIFHCIISAGKAKVPIAMVNPLLNEKLTDIDNASFYSIVSSDHPLHEAIKLSFLMILQSLLDSGVYSVNSQNAMHYSPLQFAIQCKNFEAVKIVTGYPGCNFSVKTSAGLMPLHLASQAGCLDIVCHLINQKLCDINAQGLNGDSALHIACKAGHLEIVEFLTGNPDCNVEVLNRANDRAIHEASRSNNIEIVRHLIGKGCAINVKGKNGCTPLHYACECGNLNLVKVLTNNTSYCDVEVYDNYNERAIHKAAKFGHVGIVRYLVKKKKCNIECTSQQGNPLEISLKNNHDKVTSFLLSLLPSEELKALAAKDKKVSLFLNIQKLHATDGMAVLRIGKCILTGPPRVGKTTLKKQFFGESLFDDYYSTGIAETYSNVNPFRKVSKETALTTSEAGKSQWKKHEQDDELYLLYQNVLNDHRPQSLEPFELNLHFKENSESVSTSANPVCESVTPSIDKPGLAYSSQSSVSTSNKGVEALSKDLRTFSASKMKKCDSVYRETTSGASACTTLHVIDTGGQPEFHEMLPALVTGPAIYLITFKLDVDLRQHFKIQYTCDGDESELYESSLTHEEFIFRSLASISCLSNTATGWNFKSPVNDNSKPAVFLVATHKDLVDDAKVNKINVELKKKIESSQRLFSSNIVQFSGKAAQMCIYALDTKRDQQKINELCFAINDVLSRQFRELRLPVSWCMFSLKLRASKRKHYLYEACFSLASNCGINSDDEFRKVLWFLHHRAGVIMYYPEVEGLDNVIFTDPQLVFDRITHLIKNCFSNNEEVRNAAVVRDFQDNGKFSKSTLNELSARQKQDPLTLERLVALLVHLYIVAPLSNEHDMYFMPCALKPAYIDAVSSQENGCTTSPLLISFDCGFVPLGVFCCLVVYLLHLDSSKSAEWTLAKGTNNRNKITFLVEKYYDTIVLLCHPTYLEVQVIVSGRKNSEIIMKEVLKTMHTGLQKVMESLRYKYESEIKFCIPCSCSFDAPHPAIIALSGVEVAYCNYTGAKMKLEEHHLPWFHEVLTLFHKSDDSDASTELIDVDDLQKEFIDGTVASRVLTRSFSEIKKSRIDLSYLADKMLERDIISMEEKNKVLDHKLHQTSDERLDELLQYLVATVQEDGGTFGWFIDVLKSRSTIVAKKIADNLEKEYLKEAKNSQSMDKMEYEEPDMATSTTPYKRKREKSFDTISSKKLKEMS